MKRVMVMLLSIVSLLAVAVPQADAYFKIPIGVTLECDNANNFVGVKACAPFDCFVLPGDIASYAVSQGDLNKANIPCGQAIAITNLLIELFCSTNSYVLEKLGDKVEAGILLGGQIITQQGGKWTALFNTECKPEFDD